MKSPSVCLVGAGVVGRAIAKAHTDAYCSLIISDQDPIQLTKAVDSLGLNKTRWNRSLLETPPGWLPSITLRCHDEATNSTPPILIESISERLDVKRDFFSLAEKHLGERAILCSNTSTLRIGAIGKELEAPERFCGMHFFMPVDQRAAVEIVRGSATTDSTIRNATLHVEKLSKEPLTVGDGPGFIVNRLLSPYLNEAMLLLGRHVSAERIEQAALDYGMPLSPLELIDWIGVRTMFEAGRVFWQSFPDRIDPSPILPALIKAKRFGRFNGGAFYDYADDARSSELSAAARELCQKYRRDPVEFTDSELIKILAIPMWIEAAIAMKNGVAESTKQFDLAMRGGLGFRPEQSWTDFFQSLGSDQILNTIEKRSSLTACMKAPPELTEALKRESPSGALRVFATMD